MKKMQEQENLNLKLSFNPHFETKNKTPATVCFLER